MPSLFRRRDAIARLAGATVVALVIATPASAQFGGYRQRDSIPSEFGEPAPGVQWLVHFAHAKGYRNRPRPGRSVWDNELGES